MRPASYQPSGTALLTAALAVRVAQADSPGCGGGFAGFEPDELLSGLEGVGRAAHRFGSQAAPAPVRAEGVGGVELDDREGFIDPEFGSVAVWPAETDPGA